MDSTAVSDSCNRGSGRLNLVAAGIVGLSVSVTGYLTFAPNVLLSNLTHQLLPVGLGALFAACYLLVQSQLDRRTSTEVHRSVRAWTVVSLVLAAVLLRAIPIQPASPPALSRSKLQVIALGEKNPASLGSEVWVLGIDSSSGSHVSVSTFEQGGSWEIRGEQVVSYQAQPARLLWTGSIPGKKELILLCHPCSGVAEVRWGSSAQRVDLYAPVTGVRRIQLASTRTSEYLDTLVGLSLFVACVVTLGTLLLPLCLLLARLRLPAATPLRSFWRTALVHASICACTWSIGLAAFWPGLMSPDSLEQWAQVLSGEYQDHHPAFHTMNMRLATRLANSPATIAVLQILALSLVTGWAIAHMRRLGAPKWVAMLSTLLMALSPVNLPIVVSIWKDIPFSIAMLLLAGMILVVVNTQSDWLGKPYSWATLAIVAALACLYRHNGPPPALGALALLVLASRKRWRRTAVALVLATVLMVAARGPLYQACQVSPGRTLTGGLWIIAHHFAAHLDAGTPMTASERDTIRQVRRDPWIYDPYQASTLMSPQYFDHSSAHAARKEAFKLFCHLTWRNPRVTLRHVREQSSLVWRITKPPGSYYYNTALESRNEPRVQAMSRGLGLDLTPKFPRLYRILTSFNDWTLVHLHAVIWRTPLYLYLLLLGVLFAIVRTRDWRYVLVAAPVLINSVVLALVTTGQDFRYQLPAYWTGLILGPYLLLVPGALRRDEPQAKEREQQIASLD